MEHFTDALSKHANIEIMRTLEEVMRQNPYGETFMTAEQCVQAETEKYGERPRFQVCERMIILIYIVYN